VGTWLLGTPSSHVRHVHTPSSTHYATSRHTNLPLRCAKQGRGYYGEYQRLWPVLQMQWFIVVEYRTRNREVAGSTHIRSTASNLKQVANLLRAQANSASYPQRNGKWVAATATATGWRPSVADWGNGVSASCTGQWWPHNALRHH